MFCRRAARDLVSNIKQACDIATGSAGQKSSRQPVEYETAVLSVMPLLLLATACARLCARFGMAFIIVTAVFPCRICRLQICFGLWFIFGLFARAVHGFSFP
jgi:hypothetical protein